MYNLELDQAMQRVRDGKYTSLEELEKEMETWKHVTLNAVFYFQISKFYQLFFRRYST
jgi:hypothetical protein